MMSAERYLEHVTTLSEDAIHVLEDLLTAQVCPRCVLRFLGSQDVEIYRSRIDCAEHILNLVRSQSKFRTGPAQGLFSAGTQTLSDQAPAAVSDRSTSDPSLTGSIETSGKCLDASAGAPPCPTCLGLLGDCDTPASIDALSRAMRAEGHDFTTFRLRLLPPASVHIRSRNMLIHLKAQRSQRCSQQPSHGTQDTLGSRTLHPFDRVEAPLDLSQALRLVLTPALESATSARHCASSTFEFTVTYTHPLSTAEASAFVPIATPPSQAGAKRKRQPGHVAGNKKVCHTFQLKGSCKFGSRCKFSHGDAAADTAPNFGTENTSQPGGLSGGTEADAEGGGSSRQVEVSSNWGTGKSSGTRLLGWASGEAGAGTGAADAATVESEHLGNQVAKLLLKLSDAEVLAKRAGGSERAVERCKVMTQTCRDTAYLAGYYLKYDRDLSQTPWVIDGETHGDGSVEGALVSVLGPALRCDNIKFQSAGREDMNVRMLGGGRPFVFELLNPRREDLSAPWCRAMEARLEEADCGAEARLLQAVDKSVCGLIKEGEESKKKNYTAIIWASRPLTPADAQRLEAMRELVCEQKTPVRVLHRRAPLTRPKLIHTLRLDLVPGSAHYAVLHLQTQAGTYIKEFVHGDFGRCSPSLCDLLACEVDILQLDVTEVEMSFVQ